MTGIVAKNRLKLHILKTT